MYILNKKVLFYLAYLLIYFCIGFFFFKLLDKLENKMKGTCVEGTIPKLFEGKMIVSTI